MGLYDYLGGYQIKIFGTPCYYNTDSIYGGLSLIGGGLISYKKGDKLPTKKLWYQFPDNFCIVDLNAYEGYSDKAKKVVHIVKDSKYIKTVNISRFNNNDIGDAVYDYYGRRLNIFSKNDIYKYMENLNTLQKKKKETEDKYFENGAFDCIKNDIKKYEELKPKYHKELDDLNNEYIPKIYLKDEFKKESVLGEYFYVAIKAYYEKDKKSTEYINYLKNYNDIKSSMQKYIQSLDENYLMNYFNWLNDYINEESKNIIKEFIENVILKDN